MKQNGEEEGLAGLTGLQKRIQALPQGMDSIYSKDYEEGGIELSGGEQQRLALVCMRKREQSSDLR